MVGRYTGYIHNDYLFLVSITLVFLTDKQGVILTQYGSPSSALGGATQGGPYGPWTFGLGSYELAKPADLLLEGLLTAGGSSTNNLSNFLSLDGLLIAGGIEPLAGRSHVRREATGDISPPGVKLDKQRREQGCPDPLGSPRAADDGAGGAL